MIYIPLGLLFIMTNTVCFCQWNVSTWPLMPQHSITLTEFREPHFNVKTSFSHSWPVVKGHYRALQDCQCSPRLLCIFFYISVSQLQTTLPLPYSPPPPHLRDIWQYLETLLLLLLFYNLGKRECATGIWWVEAKDAAKHSTKYRTAPKNEKLSNKMSIVSRLRTFL